LKELEDFDRDNENRFLRFFWLVGGGRKQCSLRSLHYWAIQIIRDTLERVYKFSFLILNSDFNSFGKKRLRHQD